MLNSARLAYRRIELSDAPFLLELLNSPGWLRFIGDRGVYDLADSRAYIRTKMLPTYAKPGFGPMLAVRRSDGVILGNVGIYERAALPAPDFGFAFLPQFHGQGYAHEASEAGLDAARQHGIPELLAITLPDNEPSLRLLGKLGFIRQPDLIRLNEEDPDELVLLRKELVLRQTARTNR